jgi:hypothetical protein
MALRPARGTVDFEERSVSGRSASVAGQSDTVVIELASPAPTAYGGRFRARDTL